MNMSNNKAFQACADAKLLDPIEASQIENLRALKQTLETDFIREFGSQAFETYYIGRPKRLLYKKDYIYDFDEATKKVHVKAEEPELKTDTCKFHVTHELFADDFGIKYISEEGVLHITKFKPYFMAMAMHQITGNDLYDELASDLFDEIQIAVKKSMQEGFDPIKDWEWSKVVDSISTSIDTMVQHTRPASLRMADNIDPMDQRESPVLPADKIIISALIRE